MRSETPATPGRKQHTPRTIKSISTPAREARYNACMTVGSVTALSLAMMRAALPACACSASRSIFASSDLVHAEGRVQEFAEPRHAGESGELQEDFVDVLADRLIRRHQPVIGIEPGGLGMVVAGAEMAIATQAVVLAPHHHHQFGVSLEAEYAVHDVRAGLLQLVGQLDVGLLVEARAQLDDDGDVLARLRRVGQRTDDGGIAAGAVQGLLDGQHLGVAGRLLDEIRDRTETLERVMQKDIAGAQRGEDVRSHPQPLRNARGKRRRT